MGFTPSLPHPRYNEADQTFGLGYGLTQPYLLH